MMFHERYANALDGLCDDIDCRYNDSLLAIMQDFAEPIVIHPNRFNYGLTYNTDAFKEACLSFKKTGIDYHVGIRHNVFDNSPDLISLSCQPIYYIFSIIELQFEELSNTYAIDFANEINDFFISSDIPWRLFDGRIIKIDALQFECDLKAKALAQMKELKDAEPKFQSAYTEFLDAVEYFDKGDYQSAINNAEKSYESILKVILCVDKGNANELTQKYRDTMLSVPETMSGGGFESQVMKSLPFIRNNSGADHGAGEKTVVISKPMARLAINLAAALNTYLIEEYTLNINDSD